jgi:hypothetical protein
MSSVRLARQGRHGPSRPALTLALGLALVAVWAGASPEARAQADGALAAAAGLVDLEGASFDLGAVVRDHEATVLIWYATGCPCVTRYVERISALRAAWPVERVAIVGVASNADDNAATVQAALAETGFPVQVVLDPGGTLARELEVVSTPTTVLLDQTGEVRFHGWLDNERPLGDSRREAYLDAALEALLGLRADAPDTSRVYGCPVTRSW